MGMFGNDGWLFGHNSLGGKFSSGFGGWLNDVTGQTQSAKTQYKNQLKLQHDAQEFSKWQMANAHQMEVQDLQAAGLNPVLSAGGSGASAGVSMGSASAGTPSADPTAMAGQIIGAINSTKQTNATAENLEANSALQTAEAWRILKTTEPELDKTIKERDAIIQQIKESKSREDLMKAQQKLADWEGRHPVAAKLLGGAPAAAASIGGTLIMGRALQLGQKAQMNAAKSVKSNAGTIYTGGTYPGNIPGLQ